MVFQDIMIIYTTLIYTHLYIWICLFSFNDFTKRKMEHRVCDTVKVYTATELKDIRMKVEQDRRLCILHTDTCLAIRKTETEQEMEKRENQVKRQSQKNRKLE